MTGSEVFLELLEYRNIQRNEIDPSNGNPGTAHICLFVEGFEALWERLRAAGVQAVSEPVSPTVGSQQGRAGHLPHRPRRLPGGTRGDEAQPRRYAALAVAATDRHRARRNTMEPIVPLTDVETFAEGLDHAEGICVTLDGTIYCGGRGRPDLRDRPRRHAAGDRQYRRVHAGAGRRRRRQHLRHRPGAQHGVALQPRRQRAERLLHRQRRAVTRRAELGGVRRRRQLLPHRLRRLGRAERPRLGAAPPPPAEQQRRSGAPSRSTSPTAAPCRPTAPASGSCGELPQRHRRDPHRGRRIRRGPAGAVRSGAGGSRRHPSRPPTGRWWSPATGPTPSTSGTPTRGLQVLADDPRGATISAPTNAVFTGEDRDVLVVPNLGRWHMSRFRSSYRGVGAFYPSAARIAGDE